MGRETKGVVRLFKAIKPVAQVALLIVGVAMVGFGIMRGEADAVLAKAIRLCLGVSELDKRKNTASHLLARFRGLIQAAATLATNIHLPNFAKGGIYQEPAKPSACRGLTATRVQRPRVRAPSGRFSRWWARLSSAFRITSPERSF